ncbi:MAG TPA: thiamine phosphate synthase [Terriglobales bacterium]|nr:thiamine phosphate synthase [Terriglobales bacterium]
MSRPAHLPRLYPILDAGAFARESDPAAALARFAGHLVAGGATVLQYRNKQGIAPQMLSQARELRRAVPRATLLMNDRADLCLAADFDGVHVGQEDLSPAGARLVVGNERWVGVSTHNPAQLAAAAGSDADYVAIGPVFATSTKTDPDPVVGLEGVRRARAATNKPLVAIGGITRANCRAVMDAGADAVAVISDLLLRPQAATEEFLRLLGSR